MVRGPFTPSEVEVLVKEAEARRQFLFGELKGPSLTQAHRDRAWAAVSEKVNAVSPVVRSVQDLKSKFADLKTRTKQKANNLFREARNTGGGQNGAEKLAPSEQLLCSFIGKESIQGIMGGLDIGVTNIHQPLMIQEDKSSLRPPSPLCAENEPLEKREATTPGASSANGERRESSAKATIISPGSSRTQKYKDSSTPKQKTTMKKCLLEASKETNVHLKNISEELKTLNRTLKRRLEIEEELLN